MTTDELFDNVQDVFREVFEDQTLRITRETTAEDVEGWDSFAHVNLIMALETRFGVKFKLAELQQMANVGDAITLIGQKVGVNA